ncbi:MAG: hypothetical protein E7378_04595 [Clostridiales bacterium]|nr:hypothetical protein [Clostridiales bacterium]
MFSKKKKIFLVVFVTIFVAIFLVYDATFFSKSNISVAPPVIEQPEIPDVQVQPELPDGSDSGVVLEPEKIPVYTNGYTCLLDAYQRFDKAKYYTQSSVGVGYGGVGAIEIVQNISVKRYCSGDMFVNETLTACDSDMGQNYFERITTLDGQSYNYQKTRDKNNYSLIGVPVETLSRAQLDDRVGPARLNVIQFRAVKGIDKLVKFDRYGSEKYYIVTISYDVGSLPSVYSENIKKESGASAVNITEYKMTYSISKTTGQIEKMDAYETYDMKIFGVTTTVTNVTSSVVTIYNQPINIPV